MPINVRFSMSGAEAAAVLRAHVESRLRASLGQGFVMPSDASISIEDRFADAPMMELGGNSEVTFCFTSQG